ncbi:MAG: hypothetical protein J5533_02230 [Bacteroidales bacterium]|nr:hypothetical protein [Bacteroidales bacterium]
MTITISIILINACSSEIIKECPDVAIHMLSTKSSIEEKTTNRILQESTNTWLIPQHDPYELSFIEETILEVPRLKEYSEKHLINLSPTHYALKIYPKNQKEIQEIESNNNIKVSFSPFHYRKIQTEPIDKIKQTDYDTKYILKEQSKYKEEQEIYDIDGNLIDTEINAMPILYVVWPTTHKLPNNYDYEIEYEVFIPKDSPCHNIESEFLDLLERKCIEKALNLTDSLQNNIRNECYGYVYQYDNWINDNLPVAGLKLRFELGSNITDITTDETGYFYVNTSPYATATAIYEETRWKITTSSSNSPITNVLNNIPGNWHNGDTLLLNDKITTLELALHYHFYSSPIPMIYQTSGIRIKIITEYAGHSGEFHPGLLSNSIIDIYLGIYSGGSLFAVITHELGHYTHYLALNGFFNFETTHRLIKESYANYVGWYITRTYYKNKKPSISYTLLDNYLSGRTCQSWEKTETGSTSYYSPLFVDLIDNHNQYNENPLYNNDIISNVPHEMLFELIHKKTWKKIKQEMSNYIGQYYTSMEYNTFIEPYDYYF